MIALLALLAAGTHAVPAPKSPALKVVTACLAVTRADVELTLGRAVRRAQEEITGGQSTCDYLSGRARVTVTLQHLERPIDLEIEMAALRKEIEGSSVRLAPQSGKQAFFLDIEGAGTQLHIISGRNYLLVSLLGFGDAADVAGAAQTLARTALSRL